MGVAFKVDGDKVILPKLARSYHSYIISLRKFELCTNKLTPPTASDARSDQPIQNLPRWSSISARSRHLAPAPSPIPLPSWRQSKGSCLVGSAWHPYSSLQSLNMAIEQLMGAGQSSRHAQLSLTDPKVCRSFLVGTCPHDLFTNTKQDLGPCPKVHSESLKGEYDASQDKAKFGFEYDYMRDMQKYIDECNRRIDAAQKRLEKTPDEIRQTNDLVG